jgi:hypothetical protein
MSANHTVLASLLAAMSLFGSPALSFAAKEGPGSSGGGDNPAFEDGSAWFVGDRPIHVCYEVASGFFPSRPAVDVAQTIDTASRSWSDYLEATHLFENQDSDHSKLVFHLSIMVSCDGSEDLKIYFGGTNEEIEKAKAKYSNPTGLAQRTQYDLNTAWGKGFIWIAPPAVSNYTDKLFPNWSVPDNLGAILLHEFGHVLGCAHVAGTIMQEDIAELLLDEHDDYLTARLTHIDGSKFLFGKDEHISGKLGSPADPSEAVQTFSTFMGRMPSGRVQVFFNFLPFKGFISLTFSDELGSVERLVEFNQDGPGNHSMIGSAISGSLFRVARKIRGTRKILFEVQSGASVIFGSLRDANGNPIAVEIDLNMEQGTTINLITPGHSLGSAARGTPVAINYFDHGLRKPLFTMNIVGLQ